MPISLEEVRRRILIALFSDDELMITLVLKGGNALMIVHEVGNRISPHMDFSIASYFPDLSVATSHPPPPSAAVGAHTCNGTCSTSNGGHAVVEHLSTVQQSPAP